MDAAELISLHASGAGESLARAIEKGDGPKVEPFPEALEEARREQSKADAVGELLAGFKQLKRGWRK